MILINFLTKILLLLICLPVLHIFVDISLNFFYKFAVSVASDFNFAILTHRFWFCECSFSFSLPSNPEKPARFLAGFSCCLHPYLFLIAIFDLLSCCFSSPRFGLNLCFRGVRLKSWPLSAIVDGGL